MKQLIDLDKKHFIHPTSSIKQQQEQGAKSIIKEGDGIYLKDFNGKTFIDAMSSLWNVNIGHGRKELAEAAKQQMETLAFSSAFSTFSHEPAIQLAEKIAAISPGNLNAVFFTSGGSESNDSAFKLVRHFWKLKGEPQRNKIIALKKGYHGVASASTSATGIPEFWEMADLTVPGFIHAESPYEQGTEKSIRSIREKIESEGRENIAAFIAEPVQGAGGVLIPPDDYFKEVRQLCDEYGILFIADEVITGFGRTGKMFGLEHCGVVPDMMTFAKGVTSGYIPFGGVVVSDPIHNVLKEKSTGTLFHGFTYSGHPTAAAVALKNIEIIEQEGLVANSQAMGDELLKGFKQMKQQLDIVGDVRTTGLLGAMELVEDPETNKRFSADLKVAPEVIEALHERGVICRAVTYEGTDIICFAPPLIINKTQIQTLLEKLHDAVLAVQKQLGDRVSQ
ncbi:aspartate aminotransferase family protein [Halobacillus shinanisalinarum]|uniref:Aspartate aminotransferase family protein n=1 Tax=Halobacillus shinanisalinarum TaxID=2932258 RepID=A0ABY4GWS9_9BACI|nr:aspartate aminotransferase family protein [Halobacillus shinanisalinarum]UOQ92399.1 aspartate aminotransferase family protein [Halobacillus shinanisalinarum]